jgi:hypothetical protein
LPFSAHFLKIAAGSHVSALSKEKGLTETTIERHATCATALAAAYRRLMAANNMTRMQARDVKPTAADVDHLSRDVGFSASTPIEVGVRPFRNWSGEYSAADEPPPTRGCL